MEERLSKIFNKCCALSTVFHTAFLYAILHSLRTHTATQRINWQSFTQLIDERRWFSVELRR